MPRPLKHFLILLTATFLSFPLLRPSLASILSQQRDINPEALTAQFSHEKKAYFQGDTLSVPSVDDLLATTQKPKVLGDQNSDKRIEVDLTNQRLYAYEGDRQVYNFLISSGKWGRTPTGQFRVWIKLRATKMEGGNKALHTYYYLPNVPYVMYFYNEDIPKYRGYGIHGTYWHSNFGHPMSHGCINMKTEEAKLLYDWANPNTSGNTTYADDQNPGTLIVIYGTAPQT